ncbi:hypothetical protein [Oceanobacillus aidingensis]
MVYLNQEKHIYAEDIKGASSNQETFVYEYASEREQKQLEMQRESVEVLQQLQRDTFAKNQQLERIAKRLKEMDKNEKDQQQMQEKVFNRLDVLDKNIKKENKQLNQIIAAQESAKEEEDGFKANQALIQVKLEKIDEVSEAVKKKVEEQGNKLDEMDNQRKEELAVLHERLDKQEA